MIRSEAIRQANQSDPALLGRLERIVPWCIAVTLAVSVSVLLGWSVPGMASVFPDGWLVMKVNTALAAALCAISVTCWGQTATSTVAARACASVVLLLSLGALLEHVGGIPTGLGTLVIADTGSAHPGLMSVPSATAFTFLAVALMIEPDQKGPLGRVLDVAGLALAAHVVVLAIGYVFGTEVLFGQTATARTSVPTLVSLALLAGVVTIRRAPHGAPAVLVGVGIGSHFARVALPTALGVSLVIIATGAKLIDSGTLSLPYAAAMTTAALAVVLGTLTFWLANRINILDAHLRSASLTDEMTGLANLRGLYLVGEQLLRDTRRQETPVTLLFFDVDGLKPVNDTLGHKAGSELIVDVASILRTTFRRNDVVGRLGGDEFVVIARGEEARLTPVLHRFQAALDRTNAAGDKPYRVSVSVGMLTVEPQSDESLDELLHRADEAMYREKRRRGSARETMRVA